MHLEQKRRENEKLNCENLKLNNENLKLNNDNQKLNNENQKLNTIIKQCEGKSVFLFFPNFYMFEAPSAVIHLISQNTHR